MLRNYLLIAYRNLLRHKLFSLINISGLAIGMAACLLIMQYVSFEWSYDNFHEKSNLLYRVDKRTAKGGEVSKDFGRTYAALGPALLQDLPGVEDFTRLHPAVGETTVTYQANTFREDKLVFADPSFLRMLSFLLVRGDVSSALSEPNSTLISESAVLKYFGKEDPMGKTIALHDLVGEHTFRVTGILRDLPPNSQFSFDFLLSNNTVLGWRMYQEDWVWSNFDTYVQLQEQADPAEVQAMLTRLNQKYTTKDMRQSNIQELYFLKPLKKIHLFSHVDLAQQAEVLSGEGKTAAFLAIIAAFILLIGYINYINLYTARAMERAKEVGVRKLIGASRPQLVKQLLLDALVVSGLAFVLALTLSQLAYPVFLQFVGKPMPPIWEEPRIWWALLGAFILGSLLSGLYPALSLSSLQPITVLKGRFTHSGRGAALRKGLVVFQFSVSVVLIAGTFTVSRQLQHMQDQELGADIEQKIVIKGPIRGGEDSDYRRKWEMLKNSIRSIPAVSGVTASDHVPGRDYNWSTAGIKRESDTIEGAGMFSMVGIDEEFVPAYQLRIVVGRNFSSHFPSDQQTVLLSETAVKQLGFEGPQEAVGESIIIEGLGTKMKVLGVVNDYHAKSLHYQFDPLIYLNYPASQRFYSMKIDPRNLSETVSALKVKFEKVYAGSPFEYYFLDETFNAQYESDQQLGKIFTVFAAMAIIVASLGLFGLASFSTTQRTKEIGVRKVLGASVFQIMALLSRDFLKLVLLANLLAWPLAWWGMRQWLQQYAFRIDLSPWLFVLPSLLVLLIALLTVSAQTWRAARANPVNSLRNE